PPPRTTIFMLLFPPVWCVLPAEPHSRAVGEANCTPSPYHREGVLRLTSPRKPRKGAGAALERPGPLARPALDDDLRLRVELDAVPALRVQVAEEALPPAAEREEGHRRGHADVDAHVARPDLAAELPRVRAARCED